jgi:hypothetical protein
MLAPADFDGYYGLGVAATADASTIFVSFNQSSGAPEAGFIAYSANLPAVVSAAALLYTVVGALGDTTPMYLLSCPPPGYPSA